MAPQIAEVSRRFANAASSKGLELRPLPDIFYESQLTRTTQQGIRSDRQSYEAIFIPDKGTTEHACDLIEDLLAIAEEASTGTQIMSRIDHGHMDPNVTGIEDYGALVVFGSYSNS